MTQYEFEKAIAEGKDFMMTKYKYCSLWSTPKRVTAEIAEAKSRVRVNGGYCPYDFEIIE